MFFARCVDLYLKDGGVIGMVLPHSALQSGQYTKWRSRRMGIPARRPGPPPHAGAHPGRELCLQNGVGSGTAGTQHLLSHRVLRRLCGTHRRKRRRRCAWPARWNAVAGDGPARTTCGGSPAGITDTSVGSDSPYAGYARQGASIVPRCLFFVTETENTAIVQAAPTVTVNPRRGGQDKAPWRDLDLAALTDQTIESRHLYDVHLGETVVPYATLEPLQGDTAGAPRRVRDPDRCRRAGRHQPGRLGTADAPAGRLSADLWDTNKGARQQSKPGGTAGLLPANCHRNWNGSRMRMTADGPLG